MRIRVCPSSVGGCVVTLMVALLLVALSGWQLVAGRNSVPAAGAALCIVSMLVAIFSLAGLLAPELRHPHHDRGAPEDR